MVITHVNFSIINVKKINTHNFIKIPNLSDASISIFFIY